MEEPSEDQPTAVRDPLEERAMPPSTQLSRLLWGLVLGLAVSGFLAGCQRWPDVRDLPLPFLPTPTPEPIRLRVVAWDEGEATERLEEWLLRYDRLRPEVWVELEILDEYAIAAPRRLAGSTPGARDVPHEGGGPEPVDLVLVDAYRFPDLAQAGLLAPVPTLAVDDLDPRLVDPFRWDGQLFCRPREVRPLALVYHRELLAQAGREPPTTWEELREVAEATSDLDTGTFGLIEAPDLSRWLPFLLQAGGRVIDDQGRMALDSPQALQALEFYIDLFRENLAGEPGEVLSSWAGEVLGQGLGAMAVEGPWVVPYFAAEFPDLAYGVAPLPRGPGGPGTVAFTSCWALDAASPHPTAAVALLQALAEPEAFDAILGGTSWIPPDRASQARWATAYPELAPFVQELEHAQIWQFPPGFDPVVRAFNRGMQELFVAAIEPADLLGEVQRIGEEVLASCCTTSPGR